VVAILGLSTWKRQLKGKVEYDLAKKILKLLFQYRDSIESVRRSAMWAHEMPSPPEENSKNFTWEQKNYYGQSEAYKNRWEKVRIVRSELYPELLEAEVIWGENLNQLLHQLFQLEQELLFAIEDQLEVNNPNVMPDEKEHLTTPESRKARRKILYSKLSTKEDEFKESFSEELEKISNYLKRYLKKYI
jgi:hypothetical protein